MSAAHERPLPHLLRPYQADAIESVLEAARTGIRRTLLVLPTGGGKCVNPDTLVWCDGLRKFGEIWGASHIEGPYGRAAISGWYDDGARDGLRVRLECGIEIDATQQHRVWARTAWGSEGWVHVWELTSDDYVAVARGRAEFGQTTISLDDAYTLGLAIADGCITGLTFQLDKQRPVLERVLPVVERWRQKCSSGRAPLVIEEKSPRNARLRAFGNFREFMLTVYGIEWKYSEHRVVPPCILTGTRDVVIAFLRGYFDGDGYCDRRPAVSTASAELARQVHMLLLGLGVYASLRTKPTPALDAHVIEVRDVDAFARHIGFTPYGLIKDRSFERLLHTRRNTNIDVVPHIGDTLRSATRLIPGHWQRRDSWRHADMYYQKRRPSYSKIADFLSAIPPSAERLELLDVLERGYAWSQVESVTPSYAHRIDCEIEGHHAFIGNGIINHNTVIASSLVKRTAEDGKRTLFLAHRRELVNQAYRQFIDAGIEEKNVGVIMSADPRYRPGALVQVASVDTLRTRRLPRADQVLTDEAHRSTSPSYRSIQAAYSHAMHLGLTATPFRADGTPLGDMYDHLIVATTPKELIAQGALVEPRCFTVPPDQRPDLSKVKVRRGDYDERELADAMDRSPLIGNLVEHWRKHADGVATIVFATSVAHSQHITERFRDAGIAVEHLDGNTETSERDAILKRLASGETQVVSSVNCLAEGLDIPRVKCAILARPTKSLGLYMQQAGRILRPYQGQPAIILDHAGCVLEHGLPQDDREYSLKPKPKREKSPSAPPPVRECPGCSALLPIQTRTCPFCDESLLAEREAPVEAAGELIEVNEQSPELRIAHWKHLCGIATRHGLNPRWILHKYRDRFGEEPPAGFALPGWKPKTDEQKQKYLQTLLTHEPSARWARVRYRAEVGEKAPRQQA